MSSNQELETPSHVREVLQTMARQAELDAELEDAKALLPMGFSLEEAFDVLDRFRKGSVADTDIWQFLQDSGSTYSFSSVCSLVQEVKLFHHHGPSGNLGCLSLRELGTLLLPKSTQEYDIMHSALSDEDARSRLYAMRGHTMPTPLTGAAKYHMFRLLDRATSAAEELEMGRKQLALLPGCDATAALHDAFEYISNARYRGSWHAFMSSDFRRALFEQGILLSENEIGVLFRRYAPPRSVKVSLSDFMYQLRPRALWR